ncbi:MAG TPA: sensor histidine kinase [Candidatus Dormibacteraeota bacterium]
MSMAAKIRHRGNALHPWSRVAPIILWLLVVLLAAIQLLVSFAVDWHRVPSAFQPNSASFAGGITLMTVTSVGALIALRRPGNRVGWLVIAIGMTACFIDLPRLYAGLAVYADWSLPGALWLYWFSQFAWIMLFGEILVLLPLIFPDGRLLGPRWRWPIGLFAITVVLGFIGSLDPAATSPLPNPAAIHGLPRNLSQAAYGWPFLISFFGACILAVASLVVRYRRGGDQERQQVKWLLAAVVLLLVALIVQILVPALQNSPLMPLAASSIPVAIGIAVLRYRLYDIDLIINKALVYGGLAAVITAAYLLIVIGVGAFVGSRNQLAVSVVTTLVIALTFHPLRERTQRLANRLVYGRRSTPYETLSQFSEHLSQTFSQEDILDRMSRVLAQATGAERGEVWVRRGSRLLLASSSPALNGDRPAELPMPNGVLPAMERDQVVAVTHQGELLGALAVIKKRGETMNAVEQKLVTDLAAQAGLVLKNVGLNRELMARLDDLRASRQRLVAAQDDERRRLERNLHDGAQQHLVALKVNLALAEAAAQPETKVRSMLGQLKADADEALNTMRELARGIYPPLLASDGLAAALQAQIRRVPIPVELDAGEIARQPREVESAVYFCCLEALQNIAKYAHASKARVQLSIDDGQLVFRVTDDGDGFDTRSLKAGSGLENMRDRVDALGGTLQVISEPGRGTIVEGRVPASARSRA